MCESRQQKTNNKQTVVPMYDTIPCMLQPSLQQSYVVLHYATFANEAICAFIAQRKKIPCAPCTSISVGHHACTRTEERRQAKKQNCTAVLNTWYGTVRYSEVRYGTVRYSKVRPRTYGNTYGRYLCPRP